MFNIQCESPIKPQNITSSFHSNDRFHYCITFLLFSECSPSAITVTCPLVFQNGPNIIKCSLNTTIASSEGCATFNALMRFELTLPGQLVTQVCTTSTTTCEPEDNDGCGCDSFSGNMKFYSYNFIADSSLHSNAGLSCSITCLSGVVLSTAVHGSCQQMQFGKLPISVQPCECLSMWSFHFMTMQLRPLVVQTIPGCYLKNCLSSSFSVVIHILLLLFLVV